MTRQRWTKGGLVLLSLVVWVTVPSGLWADIIPEHDYNPVYVGSPDPWNIPVLQVGIDAHGKVTVTDGSVINAADALLVGVHVTGGETDLGELLIQSGGQVNAATVAYIGGSTADLSEDVMGGTGRVTVGPDSSLTVGSDAEGHDNPLYVGFTGQGTLSVEPGAQVTTRSVVVGGGPRATGHVIVDDASLDAGHQLLLGVWAGNAAPDTVDVTINPNVALRSGDQAFVGI